MRSLVDSLNRPWQVLNFATGETFTVQACSAESAVVNLIVDKVSDANAYLVANPLHVGERTTAIGDYCALTSSPRLEDIFNA